MVLLLTIAGTSILGTVVPQNANPVEYFRAYGAFLYRLFNVLDIFNMYHSWWFQSLLILLTINIIVCSIDRLSAIWKIVFVRNPSFNVSRFRKLSQQETFTENQGPDALIKAYEPFISKHFGYTKVENTDKGLCLFAEKWRWTRLGVYTVHLSVVLLLLGGLIGSIFGFEGFVNIPVGETVDRIQTRSTGDIRRLGFEIKCNNFNISFYDNGAPKEYRSSLTIIEKNKPVYHKDIVVNDPLRYKGFNIFQASYGKMPSDASFSKKSPEKKDTDEITLNFSSQKSGKSYPIKTMIGKPVDIPEGLGKFLIVEHRNSAEFKGQNVGEAYVGILTPNNGKPINVLLPVKFAHFDKMRRGDVVISVEDHEIKTHNPREKSDLRYYTGLQVTKDPGVVIVYTGFIMMIIGCFITFFMSHQRVCVEITQGKAKSKIIVTGTANKNKLGMRLRVKKLSERLSQLSHQSS